MMTNRKRHNFEKGCLLSTAIWCHFEHSVFSGFGALFHFNPLNNKMAELGKN